MALTPEGTPYVESSDLVANYPAASLSLANRVDLVGVLPFASAAARTTAIPSPTDGQYSYLQDTNSTEFYNGSAWIAAGKILQVLSVSKINSFSTTNTAFTDVTDLTLTITPASVSNKIMVFSMLSIGNALVNYRTGVKVIRGASTTLTGNTDAFGDIINVGERNGTSIYMYLDSPATTSATTYKVQIRNEGGSTSAAKINDLGGMIPTSTFTVIEVAA